MPEGYNPSNLMHSIAASKFSEPRIMLDGSMPTSESSAIGNVLKIGIGKNDLSEHGLAGSSKV